MIKRFCIVLSLISLSVASAFGLPQGVSFNISYYDKELYYTNTPIFIKASLVNNSNEVYSFQVADKKVFNLGLKVSSLENISLEPSEDFIREKNDNQPVFFRDVILNPEEEFSFLISLSDFVNVNQAGVYLIQGEFFSHLRANLNTPDYKGQREEIASNTLVLFVRPALSPLEAVKAAVSEEVAGVLRKKEISPDEVVVYMLDARQANEPDKFFLYLDTESLILEDPNYSLAYRTDEKSRLTVLNEYRNFIWKGGSIDIGRIPATFEVLNTNYTPNTGKVLVRIGFNEGNFVVYKDYTFYLRKKDLYWMIYNYSVQNSSIQAKKEN